MSNHPLRTPEQLLHDYFRAKDGNRPHLMSRVFSESATLEMIVKAGTISFPPISHGVGAIADVLVRRFAQTYENIYSFYFQRPPSTASQFSCDWLVGMSEKAGGAVRVGCGRYDWYFQAGEPMLVDRLAITIEFMQVLSPHEIDSIMGWLMALSYPWCSAREALVSAPPVGELAPVIRYLGLRAEAG